MNDCLTTYNIESYEFDALSGLGAPTRGAPRPYPSHIFVGCTFSIGPHRNV